MRQKILLICGSLNQTTMMHQIAQHLGEYDCSFTPFYADGMIGLLSKSGLLNFSILGGNHRKACMAYLENQKLAIDVAGKQNTYDAVITCTDLLVQRNIRGKRLVLVQEGMTEREDIFFTLVKNFHLPRYFANTAATGLSDAYDVFCVASPGYRDLFIQKGVKPDKLVVTGIPNFDWAERLMQNDFPLKDYVLVATSSIRETGKFDHRMQFLEEVKRIAAGRKVIFKLHPNEWTDRAVHEIRTLFPSETILQYGDINPMIANCSVLITQFSSVVFIGMSLGKEVHSYFDNNELQRLMPMQTKGRSAEWIAHIVDHIVHTPIQDLRHAEKRRRLIRKWQPSDL
jgi:hypothetical protein